MNFHPDKQLLQVAGTRDQTTDPWITRPALLPTQQGQNSIICINRKYSVGVY